MRVESLHIYPVKATAPIALQTATVEPWGLEHDRRWAVIDADGNRLNSTRYSRLLQVSSAIAADGSLTLSCAGLPDQQVPVPVNGDRVAVTIKRLDQAVDAGEAAAHWFSGVVERPARLIWQSDPRQRTIGVDHGGTGNEPLSLADTAPLLLTTTASMNQLNAWIADGPTPEPLPIDRFRPNVVIDGDIEPFAEDEWRTIRIGSVEYRFTEHCDRCVTTTIDRATLQRSKEPIRTLATHRHWGGKTWFGVRVTPLSCGRIDVGAPVSVVQRS